MRYHVGSHLPRGAAVRWAGIHPYDALSRSDVTLWGMALVLALRAAAHALGLGAVGVRLAGFLPLAADLSFVPGLLLGAEHWAMKLGVTAVNFQPVEEWTPETKGSLWIGPELLPELEAAAERLVELKRSGAPILNSTLSLSAWGAHFRGEKAPAETMPCRVGK